MSHHVVAFLASMGEPEMAEEVLSMHNRLEAFATGLDRDCLKVLHDRIEQLERQSAALREALEDLGVTPEEARAGVERSRANKKDAARYRWLREKRNVLLLTGFFGNGCINRTIEEVDAAIDAALSADKGEKNHG